MKNVLNLIFVFILSVMITSCATQNTASTKTPKTKVSRNDYSRFTNLADILRTKGLDVQGVGNNITIRIRGTASINLNTQPLFVLDNVPLGNSYAMANNAVMPVNIESIRILKDISQLTRWGEQGANGVILIKTKLRSNN